MLLKKYLLGIQKNTFEFFLYFIIIKKILMDSFSKAHYYKKKNFKFRGSY